MLLVHVGGDLPGADDAVDQTGDVERGVSMRGRAPIDLIVSTAGESSVCNL